MTRTRVPFVPRRLLHKLWAGYSRRLLRNEFLSQQSHAINERPVEYRFVFEQLTAAFPRTVLDVGTGVAALPQLMRTCGFEVSAIDNIKDYWPNGMLNRHYHVQDDDILAPRIRGPFDFITCVSTLEHIRDHARAVRNMLGLLRPGGRLILTFPFNENAYVENVYALPGSIGADKYPFITQAFSRRQVEEWTAANSAQVIAQEYWRYFDGPYWTIGNRVLPPLRVAPHELHQISCVALHKS
jgi:SAM-dependent methyltransferase